MKTDYKGLFEDWEIAVAKNLVSQFQGTKVCLQREGFEDLLQECLIHWISVRDDYDPNREASRTTFMGRVMRNKLTDLAREMEADKRRVAHRAVSLDAPCEDGNEGRTLLDDIRERRTGCSSEDAVLNIHLKIDLSEALSKLNRPQRELCLLLRAGLTVSEVSGRRNTPRSTIYDEIGRIREIFQKEGLKSYLE